MADQQPAPLILCMESSTGEDVALRIEPEDDFQSFLVKAKSLLGFEVDLNSITRNQPVSLQDNIYQFLVNAEQTLPTGVGLQTFDQTLDPNRDNDDLVYILDDGTQIRASQIHFDNEDPPVDLTAEKIPFIKIAESTDFDTEVIDADIRNYNIIESPVSRWSSGNSSPKCSFINSLPFKLVNNNTSGFEAQFTRFLESNTKTYTTLNPVINRNRSPKSLIRDNYKNYDDIQRGDTFTREEILNMFKDSPVASVPYDNNNVNEKRKHIRKTDPSRLHRNFSKPISYVDVDGVLIGDNGCQNCFICGKYIDNNLDKLYLFDNEDQRLHRSSPQKKLSTQLKILCENCLEENFKPCRLKSPNQSLNADEYLIIRNNQQYIFQKTNNLDLRTGYDKDLKHNKKEKVEFVKVEIGSDGEIVTKPIDNEPRSSDDVIIVKDERKLDSSSDVEIIEPEPEIDNIIDNLEEADEEVKEFLGKYQCDNNTEIVELKCRFCERVFSELGEVMEHGDAHKHDLEDEEVFPCPLCDYGYASLKWLRGHLKAAHDKKPEKQETIKEEQKEQLENENGTDEKVSIAGGEASPIAKRTRSAVKKTSESQDSPDKPADDENKDSNAGKSLTEGDPPMVLKTEVKQECMDSSDDEIWIVQAADDNTHLDNLLQKSEEVDKDGAKKQHKCFNCSEIFPSAEGLSAHKCKKRGRKRKLLNKADAVIRVPSQEDFIKRAQGRPRKVEDTGDLLVVRSRKRKNKEPTSDPQIVTCHNCNESFTSKVRLRFHMQFHDTTDLLTADGRYTCIECDDTTFATETELFDHVHFQHDKQKRWQCPVQDCGKTFYLRATLTKHSRTHTDTRRYVCVTCGKRFLDKQTLDEHGVTHLQIKPFQCHICLKQLTRRSRLRMHVRAHEEEAAPRLVRVCAACARAFRDTQQSEEHAMNSKECIEEFANSLKEETDEVTVQLSPTSGLVRHTERVVESPKITKPVPCQVASPLARPLLAQLPDTAKSIIRVVEIDKAFRCEYCEDVFYLEEGLNSHRAIHKGVKNPFTCHICKVSFATYSRCTTHKTTHGFYKRSLASAKRQAETAAESASASGVLGYGDFPVVKHFLCEDCGRSYLHWTYLQVHRRMKHANENYMYKCNDCDYTFPNSWSVAYHRKKMHGKTAHEDGNGSTKIVKEDYRIPCRDCNEVLPNKTALYKHRKKEHSDGSIRNNSKQGVFCCGVCDKQYGSRAWLYAHARTHTAMDTNATLAANAGSSRDAVSSSACVCGVCGRGFRSASVRDEHLRVHTGERPFPCDLCPLAFRRCTAMRNHRLIHTGVRAWPCPRCPKRFRIRSELRTHVRLKHPHTCTVLEVEGLDPSFEQVMQLLTEHNIPQDKVIEINKVSFQKGSTSVIPDCTRALTMLTNLNRAQLFWEKPAPERPVEDYQPVRRGRGIAKNPRRPKILQRGEERTQQEQNINYPAPLNPNEELPDLNVPLQLLLRDGVLVNGNQMVQLQLDDTMLLE